MAAERANAATDQDDDQVSDATLVHRMMEGSQAALGSLYDRHSSLVFSSAMQTSRDRWIAEEVVQETFLTLWNRAESFDPARGALPTWLMAVARNRAIDRLRAAGRYDRAASFSSFVQPGVDRPIDEWLAASGDLIGIGAAEPVPEVALRDKETRSLIEDALATLHPTEHQVIALAYRGGLSQSEIATTLGWPIGTVKTRTRRGLRHLRERLAGSVTGKAAPGTGAERMNASPCH